MNRFRSRRAAIFIPLLVFIFLLIAYVVAQSRSAGVLDESGRRVLIAENRAAGRDMQALYQVEALAAENGWTADLSRTAGDIWEKMGDFSRAAAYYENAARHQPEDAALARHLAGLYLDLQRWPEAGDTLRRLLRLAPEDTWAHYHLGLLEAAFNPASAAEHFRFASADPLYNQLALELVFVLEGASPDAVRAMQAGVAFADFDLWPYAELAFAQAVALGGDALPEAFAYAALARDQQGKSGALLMRQAVALAPANPQVRYLQGLHLRAVDDLLGSRAAFAQAAALAPDNPAIAAELGAAYQLVGDMEQAESWLKAAVALSGDDPRFQELLTAFYAAFQQN